MCQPAQPMRLSLDRSVDEPSHSFQVNTGVFSVWVEGQPVGSEIDGGFEGRLVAGHAFYASSGSALKKGQQSISEYFLCLGLGWVELSLHNASAWSRCGWFLMLGKTDIKRSGRRLFRRWNVDGLT